MHFMIGALAVLQMLVAAIELMVSANPSILMQTAAINLWGTGLITLMLAGIYGRLGQLHAIWKRLGRLPVKERAED